MANATYLARQLFKHTTRANFSMMKLVVDRILSFKIDNLRNIETLKRMKFPQYHTVYRAWFFPPFERGERIGPVH